MQTLVVGATGQTGSRLVAELLRRGRPVKAVVRSADRLPEAIRDDLNLAVVEAPVLELSNAELAAGLDGCDAVASCLGHTLSLRGVFGPPRRLVTDAIRRLGDALVARERPARLVLMSSAGVRNHDLDEPISATQRAVLAAIRTLVPPHADNEQAAEWLRTRVSPGNSAVEWAVVRPDSLVNDHDPRPYSVHASPIRSAIFDPGKTSRENVARFMADLIGDDELWETWKGQMPVVYDSAESRRREPSE